MASKTVASPAIEHGVVAVVVVSTTLTGDWVVKMIVTVFVQILSLLCLPRPWPATVVVYSGYTTTVAGHGLGRLSRVLPGGPGPI
jgi:hypothetical protein